MNPIAQRLRSLAARTALDGIAEEMRAIADELAPDQQAQEGTDGMFSSLCGRVILSGPRADVEHLVRMIPDVDAPEDALPDLNPEDVVVDVVLKQLGGFAPVTTHGVRVTHKPSRVSVVVDSERSQHRNRQLALDALRALIRPQDHPVPAPVAGEREKAEADAALYGTGFIVDGWRVAPHRVHILAMRPAVEPMTDGVFDLICGAIDKADTVTMEGDYMMDSDDCIAVVRVMQALLSVRGVTAKAEGGA